MCTGDGDEWLRNKKLFVILEVCILLTICYSSLKLTKFYCIRLFFVIFTVWFLDVERKAPKNFLDLMAIPGCALLFIHCASLGYTLSSFRVGISNYLVFEVETFAFDYCRENEQKLKVVELCFIFKGGFCSTCSLRYLDQMWLFFFY